MENYNTNSVNNYSEEEAIRYYAEMKKRLDKDNRLYVEAPEYTPHAYTPIDAYLKKYLANYTCEDLHKKADAMIKTQKLDKNDEFIDYMSAKNLGDYHHFRSQWSPVAMQAREQTSEKTVKVGGKVVYTYDLNFSIAETLEMQDSSQDPVTEYYDWIKIQKRTEDDLYTDGATHSEIDARNRFISHMDIRETELKRVILLYSEAAFNSNSALQSIAQEKLKFLTFKLSELRRLRDRMAASKSHADRPDDDKQPQNETPDRVGLIESVRRKMYTTIAEEPEQEDATLSDDVFNFLADRRNRYLMNLNIGMMYANNRMNPHSKTRSEADKKIETATNNQQKLHMVINGLRRGMSKEELLREAAREGHELDEVDIHRVYNRHLRGFEVAAYQQAINERDANK